MKDYSKSSIFGPFPILIGYLINSILILPILFIIGSNNLFIIFLILGFTESFIMLPLTGKYLDKHCKNNNIEKCKKCHNWNCTRLSKKNKK